MYSPVFGTIGLDDADAIWDLTPESGVASITAADLDADGAVEVMIGNPSESTNARGAGAAFVMPERKHTRTHTYTPTHKKTNTHSHTRIHTT